jgi:hypothetical protein
LTLQQIAEAISARGADNDDSPTINGCTSIFQDAVEKAKVPKEALRAVDFVAVEMGCDVHISTNAKSGWVKEALKNNKVYSIRSVLGRDDGEKRSHLQKIFDSSSTRYIAMIVVGDNPHDFIGEVADKDVQIVKVAVNVDPDKEDGFKNVGVDIIEHGPLTVQVMKNALGKVK